MTQQLGLQDKATESPEEFNSLGVVLESKFIK